MMAIETAEGPLSFFQISPAQIDGSEMGQFALNWMLH